MYCGRRIGFLDTVDQGNFQPPLNCFREKNQDRINQTMRQPLSKINYSSATSIWYFVTVQQNLRIAY